MTVFIPVTLDTARRLRTTGQGADLTGYAVGPALRTWLAAARLDDEELDYVALNHAGVAALTLAGDSATRLVLAADLAVSGSDELGAVAIATLAWTDVRSLFADEESAADAVASARAAVTGLDLAAALADPAVEALQEAYDLLWFAPEELDSLA